MPADPYIYIDDNDETLESFSIDQDHAYMLPILKQALSINPKLKFLATAWTAPSFMKDKNRLFGGDFLSTYTDLYATYLSMILIAYKDEGIEFDFMTTQNEPKVGFLLTPIWGIKETSGSVISGHKIQSYFVG